MQSLNRAIDVLEAVGASVPGLTLTELSDEVQLHKSTAHRILSTLLERGVVARVDGSGKYTLGIHLLELGEKARRRLLPIEAVRTRLRVFRDRFDETTHYAVPQGHYLVYVEKFESSRSVRIASSVGSRLELYCTALGKAFLAHQDRDYIEDYLSTCPFVLHTERTITTPRGLLRELAKVRQAGYAVDDRENEDEIRCVGAPIIGNDGRAIAAISTSAPASRFTLEIMEEIATELVTCARDVSGHLSNEVGS